VYTLPVDPILQLPNHPGGPVVEFVNSLCVPGLTFCQSI
jgi:hypothetical protein